MMSANGPKHRSDHGKLWPLIRNHCPMHDRFYRLAGVRSQPIAKPNLLLGAGYQDLAKITAEIA